MRKEQQRVQDSWDHLEHDCQVVIGVLGHPTPTSSPEYQDALVAMSRGLDRLAVNFLGRLGVPGPHAVAPDAVQRWHLQMLKQGFNQYRRNADGRPFAPYGRRTLWNVCLTIKRQKRNGGDTDAAADVADSHDAPPLAAERAEVREIVLREVAELSPKVRDALTLTDLQGLCSHDAATELGITDRIVNGRRFRGRQQLRKRLSATGLVPQDLQS